MGFIRLSPILEAKDECVIASVEWEGKTFRVIIRKNEERNFDTSCQCESEKEHPLCIHKDIVFLQLLRNFGAGYFDTIRNLDKEKNKLLSLYGYSLSDDLTGKFEFTYTDGKPYLRVLDTSIKRVAQVMPAMSMQESRSLPTVEAERWEQAAAQPTTVSVQQLGVVLAMEGEPYQPLQFIAIQGEPDETQSKYISKVTRLDISKYINQDVFSDDDKATLELLRKLQPC